MNVLLIRSDVGLAGPAKLMHAYAIALRNAGHSVHVASGGGEYARELEKDGFPHVLVDGLRIGSRNLPYVPASAKKIASLVAKEQITVINSFNAHAGLLAFLADPFRRAKHFNTVLGTGKEWTNRFLCGWAMPGEIIAVSNDVRDRLIAAGVPGGKITVVYNSTLSARFFTPLPNRTDKTSPTRLCGIAMFTGNKGQEFIIPLVAALINERGLDLNLTLVGDGPSRPNCERMARDLGIADSVKFAGALIDVVPELDASDIFIHLPRTETFGIVLAEAMARSLPVVTVGVGGIPEVVEDGKTGIIVRSRDDQAALIEAVERLVANPGMRLEMAQHAHKTAFEKFSLAALQEDLTKLYSKNDSCESVPLRQRVP